ncbi:hypothetical protein H2201_003564 [Coniosporium apollinis]|uniref:Ketoreductase domain-containing protein n=2 Tax=Coniosporium TaxID=2810619 RepID=A0ABQ9NVG3_9PEZI|nr:hypothetical protein H2199_008073 [Cladosporium sp. JES 115]KAJ9666376.1 hypothetical protein H2201_003564 [Coniosporium apollinis]
MDSFSLKGKTAVLTGAARGLGLAFAQVLAEAGANIAVLDVIQPDAALQQIEEKHHVRVRYYKTDVTSRDEVMDAITKIEEEFGEIHINVNAAGVVTDEPFLTTSDRNLERTFAVNFTGSFLVAQACANSMVRRWERNGKRSQPDEGTSNGCIVFVTSIATHIASCAQQISCYTASKAAVRGLVKPLAMELSKYGIRVNSLSPGYMMTDMMRGLQAQQPQLVAQFEKETMFGRIGYPHELQGALLFLCSQASGWYTGQDMLVDGGASSWKHPAPL